MKFDGTVNLGNVLTLLAMMGGGFWALSEIKQQVAVLQVEQRTLRETMAERSIDTQTRLTRLERGDYLRPYPKVAQ